MKKILISLCLFIFCLASQAQPSYISTDTNIILESGSSTEYATPIIFVRGQYEVRQEQWLVTMGLSFGVFSASMPIKAEYSLRFTKTEIDAFTGTGTGDTEKIQNALEQAVVDYLQPLNVSTTFTIN